MNRMEILEQLHRIQNLTDPYIPEAAARAHGLILEFERMTTHMPPSVLYDEPLRSEKLEAALAKCAPNRKADTPDELLDLMASISSDPQVEGLSLSQKASTMALLHIAKALQQIAQDVKCLNENTCEGFDTVCIALQNVEPFHDRPSTHD